MSRVFSVITLIILPFNVFLKNNDLDVRTKSYSGWLRIINSPEKLEKYHLKLDKEDIKKYTSELKKANKISKEGGLF